MQTQQTSDAGADFYCFQHVNNGYTEPGLAMHMGDQLLRDLQAHPPAAAARRLTLASGLLRQALLLNPFDAALRGVVQAMVGAQPCSAVYKQWFTAAEKILAPVPDVFMGDVLEQVAALQKNDEKLLDGALHGDSLAYRFTCIGVLWEIGRGDYFMQAVEAFLQTDAGSLVAPYFAWGALRMGHADACRKLLNKAIVSPMSLHLRAELALREGKTEKGLALLGHALEAEPVLLFILYRMYEVLQPAVPARLEDVRGANDVSVVFYTWNKFDVTLETLQSLVRSDIGGAAITLLNNGSDAFAAQDFERAARDIAQGRDIEIIHLPVNVGAPAARNWLWELPHVRRSDYVAYLDDDVLLPEGWLRSYLQTKKEFPQATVVGPKVVNPGELPSVQYVPRFFSQVGDRLIRFTNNAPLFWDMGQYDYRRPCLSVMGCCHLFDRAACDSLGVPPFDVRFSPSQVDDLEHDIQVWMCGGQVLYDGRTTVVHRQDSGRKAPLSEAAWGHVWGNHMKMEAKISGSELKRVDAAVRDSDKAHFENVLHAVVPHLSDEAKKAVMQLCGAIFR